eukprot:TRINITY_DN3849_c0_g1_i5.p1 TRINITY_DN3849_c0_g1~~TRINITY_DN3849_c0_g1_i5.p1  ORF type:complete len:317 (+),score=58.49 TRINITY_DN3849_c0_g1_i5:37-987(+)
MSAVIPAEIPDDIVLLIGSTLEARDLVRLGECSRTFNMLSKDNQLWRRLVERDLPFVNLEDAADACSVYRSYHGKETIWTQILPPLFPLSSSDTSAVHEWPGRGASGNNVGLFAMLGSESAGKSTLVIRFVQDAFLEHSYDPMIESTYRKMLELIPGDASTAVTMEILDTAGAALKSGYSYHQPQILNALQATVVLVDFTSHDSLDVAVLQVQSLLEKQKSWQDLLDRGLPLPILFILSKTDVPATRWQVSMMELRKLTHRYHGHYIQVSSKTRVGVADAFTMLVLMGLYTTHQTLNDNAQPVQHKQPDKKKCVVM